MKYLHRYSLLFFVLGISQTQAQHYRHFAFWTRYQINKTLTKNWEVNGVLHYRRQNDFHKGQLNLQKPLLFALQSNVYYRPAKYPNLNITLAQFTFNRSTTLLGKENDFYVPENQEFRYAFGTSYELFENKKWTINSRLMQEFRFQKSNNYLPVGRIRGRLLAQYTIIPAISTTVFSETIFHSPPQRADAKPFRIHQFWIGSGFQWKVSSHFSVEMGYTFMTARRATVVEFDDIDIANLYFFWRY